VIGDLMTAVLIVLGLLVILFFHMAYQETIGAWRKERRRTYVRAPVFEQPPFEVLDQMLADERAKPTFHTDKELPEGHQWVFRGHEWGCIGTPTETGYVGCYRCRDCHELFWRSEFGIRPHWETLADVGPGGLGFPLAGTFGI
jgi:hypothetical protein